MPIVYSYDWHIINSANMVPKQSRDACHWSMMISRYLKVFPVHCWTGGATQELSVLLQIEQVAKIPDAMNWLGLYNNSGYNTNHSGYIWVIWWDKWSSGWWLKPPTSDAMTRVQIPFNHEPPSCQILSHLVHISGPLDSLVQDIAQPVSLMYLLVQVWVSGQTNNLELLLFLM